MKGIAALANLPKTSITITSDSKNGSIEAYKAVVKELAKIQAGGITVSNKDITTSGANPYVTHTFTTSAFAPSTATVTLAAPTAGDTITVNGLVYTAVAGAKANSTEFTVAGGNTAVAADLVDSINSDSRRGVKGHVTASAAAAVITLTQKGAVGIDGNGTTVTSSNGTRIAITASPFSNGTGISAVFKEEANVVSTNAIGRAAMTTRRKIQIGLTATTNRASLRSVNAVYNFIEKLEDIVASTGLSSAGDGTYTSAKLSGTTPYESFEWTIVKAGNVYTVTSTANS